jgi:hypothetical protein
MNEIDARVTAYSAVSLGFSVVPPREDGTKAPMGCWKTFMSRLPDLEKLDGWYGTGLEPELGGVGVVCGLISGNMEALEFDAAGRCYARFKERARALGLGPLIDRLEAGYLERSPSGGVHWLYRVSGPVAGSTKLAQYESDEINPKTGKPIIKPLIETKGEGGYIIIAPTNGRVHPTGGAYVLEAGGLESVPVITAEERDSLHELAHSFDELPEPEPKSRPKTSGSTIADYNARTTWDELLVGWEVVYERSGVRYWRRPGKDTGVSATTGRNEHDRIYVFSTATDLPHLRPLDRFDVYAHRNHGGDLSAAAKALYDAGYGERLNGQSADNADFAEGPEEWPPLKWREMPDAPAVPLDVLPDVLQKLCDQAADAYGVEPVVPLVMILTAAAALIGKSYQARLTPTWKEGAALYMVLIMDPGGGKSPLKDLLMAPLREVEKAMYTRWRAAKELADAAYREEVARAKQAKLPKPEQPPPPPMKRLIADDATIEALARLWQVNLHGLFLNMDELAELFKGLDQYHAGGKGNSLAKVNKIWNHSSFVVDRVDDQKKGNEPLRVEDPYLSIWGNLTPYNLRLLGEYNAEGTLERWLPACPQLRDQVPVLDRQQLDPELIAAWSRIVNNLATFCYPDPNFPENPDSPDGLEDFRVHVLPLDEAAKEEWKKADRIHCAEMNDPIFRSYLRGTWSKMTSQALRLAITLECMHSAANNTVPCNELGAGSVRGAWALIPVFKAHHLKAAIIQGLGVPHGAKLICNWIVNNPDVKEFSWRDITRCYKPSVYGDELQVGLSWLFERNAIRSKVLEPSAKSALSAKSTAGRKPSPKFEIHPQLREVLLREAKPSQTGEDD